MVISINDHLLEKDRVQIVLNGTVVTDLNQLRNLLDKIECANGDDPPSTHHPTAPRLSLC